MTPPRSPLTLIVALAGGLACLPGLALAQRLGQGGVETDIAWWRVGGALILCLALAVAAAYALRTRLRGGAAPLLSRDERRLRLIETLRIGHQVDVCLIACEGRKLLLAASPHGVVLLSSDAPPTPGEPT
jgi:flagellar biogenesis protein FliO